MGIRMGKQKLSFGHFKFEMLIRNLMRFIRGWFRYMMLEPQLEAKIRDLNLEIINIEAVYNNFGARLCECIFPLCQLLSVYSWTS